MGLIGRLMSGLGGAVNGFREAYFDGDPAHPAGNGGGIVEDYGAWEARQVRYAIHWSMYRNNIYRDIKRMSKQYKGQYGLYRHTRGVYNPAKRIAGFFRANLQGGSLDDRAGDGKETETAIPIAIEGDDEPLRAAIARLWWDSNWEIKKGVYTLWGPVLADVFLNVVRDVRQQAMRLEVVHPGTISYLQKDAAGEVLAYQRREQRPDPNAARPNRKSGGGQTHRTVEFLEEACLEGGRAIYRTYLDGRPYDWTIGDDGLPVGERAGAEPEWDSELTWIPLYHVQHIDEGLGWGCSELEGGRTKFDEVNDLGSKLHDQIRKMVEGSWLFTGMTNPATAPKVPRTPASPPNREPGRQELRVIYETNADAKPHSLIGTLDVEATSREIRQTLDEIEDDYPELRYSRLKIGGTVSGEALRVAGRPAAARIEERRPAYDYALMCAQMAAVAIGGHEGFDGYQGFGLESYSARRPNHRIGRRPVFAASPAEQIAEKTARFAAVKGAVDAGFPLAMAMADLGFSKADIEEVKRIRAEAGPKAAPAPIPPPDHPAEAP